ncbi:uncharacterized protein FA14DRAFT_111102, partial [Meira miltonrushii]
RSVISQIFLVYCIAFCTIGTFNALQNLGGAGQEKPYIANAATAINFALLGCICFLGGPLVNRFDVRTSLAIGTIGDPIFAAGLIVSSKYGITTFLLVAAVIRGLSTGLFWAAEGFVINAYPKSYQRARCITGWVAAKELGSLISSAINLGISVKDNKKGTISYTVYYITIGIMCFALPCSLLLSPTNKVYHKDGQRVDIDNELAEKRPLKSEYTDLWKKLCTKEVLLMLPLACYAYFYFSSMHTYVGKHFTVRSRALLAFCTAISAILGSAITALFCDSRYGTRSNLSKLPQKRRYSTIFVLLLSAISWAYFGWAIFSIRSHRKPIDWSPSASTFLKYGMAPLLLAFSMQALQSQLYWTASSYSTSLRDIALLTSIIRGTESLAQSIAYGINAS